MRVASLVQLSLCALVLSVVDARPLWADGHPEEYLSVDTNYLKDRRVDTRELRPFDVRGRQDVQQGLVVEVTTTRSGSTVWSDASVVVRGANYERLLADSRDFDRYIAMRMPNLVDSRIVIPGDSEFISWAHMHLKLAFINRFSQHFMQVRPTRGPNARQGQGQTWVGYHPSSQERQSHRISQADRSAFNEFEGAWYMEPLANGDIYCRYYLRGNIRGGIPAGRIGAGVAMNAFGSGVQQVVTRLIELQQSYSRQ